MSFNAIRRNKILTKILEFTELSMIWLYDTIYCFPSQLNLEIFDRVYFRDTLQM